MSERIPDFNYEFWMQFNCEGDAEPMFCSIGGQVWDEIGGPVTTHPNSSDLEDCLADIQAQWTAVISADYTVGPGYYIEGRDDDDVRHDGATGPATGSQGGAAAPNTAVLIRKISSRSGRRGRGRMFVPGVPEESVAANGDLVPAVRIDYQGIIENIAARIADVPVGPVGPNSFRPTLLHQLLRDPVTREPIPGTMLAPDDLVTAVVQPKVATQRRRLRR